MKRFDNSFVIPDEHCDEPLYLADAVDQRIARFNAVADLHAQIVADKDARIAELEALNATLERSNQRLRQKLDRRQ